MALLAGAILLVGALHSALGDGNQAAGASDQLTEKAEGSGLEVGEIQSWTTDPSADNLRVWVNVKNPGNESAVNLTAQLEGAEPVFESTPERYASSSSVSRGGSTTESFGVLPRTNLTVSASITNSGPRATISLTIRSPAGSEYAGQGSGTNQAVTIPRAELDADVFGDWTSTVTHTGGILPISYTMDRSFAYTDAPQNLSLEELPPGEIYPFYFTIHTDENRAPRAMTITVNGTVVEGGVETRVSYLARVEGPVEELPVVPPSTPGGGEIGVAAVAVVLVIAVTAIGAYAWVGRGWRPAKLLHVFRRKPEEGTALEKKE